MRRLRTPEEKEVKSVPWRELEHTADVGLEVRAETLEDLVAESARAFYALLFGAEAPGDVSCPSGACAVCDSGAAPALDFNSCAVRASGVASALDFNSGAVPDSGGARAARGAVPEVCVPGGASIPRGVSPPESAPEPAVACASCAAAGALRTPGAACASGGAPASPSASGAVRCIEVDALDAVELFVSWLNELLFLLEVRGERLCLRSVRLTARGAGGATPVPDPALDPTCAPDTRTGAVCPERSAGVVGATTGPRVIEDGDPPVPGSVVGVHPGVTSADAEHATGDAGNATEDAPGAAFSLVVEGNTVAAPAPSLGIKAVTYGGALVLPGPPALLRLFFDV